MGPLYNTHCTPLPIAECLLTLYQFSNAPTSKITLFVSDLFYGIQCVHSKRFAFQRVIVQEPLMLLLFTFDHTGKHAMLVVTRMV